MFQLRTQRGVTLIELMVGLAIMAFLLAVGVPSMVNWTVTNKARSAAELYSEGFTMARREAVRHNARSRLVLTPNVTNGQLDWQVDLCFPSAAVPCNDASGTWSTTATAAAGDPEGAAGFKSVFRSAGALPNTDVLITTLNPQGNTAVYFTAVGWVDTTFDDRLSSIRLDPTAQYQKDIPSVALVISLAGIATKCDPTKSGADSRACHP